MLGHDLPAIRISTAPDGGVAPGGDELGDLDSARLGQLGRASETLLNSLDQTVELPTSTNGALYLAQRIVRGWALQLLLLAGVIPFAAATLDLLSRARRRRLPLRAAWRSLRRRAGMWLVFLAIVGAASLVGALPSEPALPPPPDEPPVDSWPLGLLAVLALAAFLVWLRSRARALGRAPVSAEDELAAYTVTFVALLLVAAGTALVSPYSLVFVLPSLYTWLWLPQLGRTPDWVTDVLFGAGLAGPVLALVVARRAARSRSAGAALRSVSRHDGGDSLGCDAGAHRLGRGRRSRRRRRVGQLCADRAVEREVARPRPGGELTGAARDVDERVGCGRAGDHVRLLARERMEPDVVARSLDRCALEVVARGPRDLRAPRARPALNCGSGRRCPWSARIAGSRKSSAPTSEETGFPGSPNTSVRSRVPNERGLPGRIATPQNVSSTPRRPSVSRTRSCGPTDTPPDVTRTSPSSPRASAPGARPDRPRRARACRRRRPRRPGAPRASARSTRRSLPHVAARPAASARSRS